MVYFITYRISCVDKNHAQWMSLAAIKTPTTLFADMVDSLISDWRWRNVAAARIATKSGFFGRERAEATATLACGEPVGDALLPAQQALSRGLLGARGGIRASNSFLKLCSNSGLSTTQSRRWAWLMVQLTTMAVARYRQIAVCFRRRCASRVAASARSSARPRVVHHRLDHLRLDHVRVDYYSLGTTCSN